MGLSDEKHFVNYHRVLNRAVWYTRQGSRLLLGLIVVALLPPDAALVIGGDNTLERRNGRQIKANGCYRDAVRSSQKHTIRCFGLRWVVMMALVPLPFSTRVWALPFLCVLAPPAEEGKRHKFSVDWRRQMIRQLRRWQPERDLVLVHDPMGEERDVAFACTVRSASPEQMLVWVVQRWSVEVSLEGLRAQRGMEMQRQWSEKAMARTTLVLMGLFSLVALQCHAWYPDGQVPLPQAAWYEKEQATFSDLLRLVRQRIWRCRYFVNSDFEAEMMQLPRETGESLLDCLCYAA